MLAAMLADGSFRSLLDAAPQGPALPPELLEGAQQAQARIPAMSASDQGNSWSLLPVILLIPLLAACFYIDRRRSMPGGGIAHRARAESCLSS